ncbi:hypothetical protein EU519_01485 [Candidatus Thorarchaeota archaeon]|nr:MAG: hypothetical protein EU519_01485 [Candidatus Thorarchaeota archaeon]
MNEEGYREYLTDREQPIPHDEIERAIPMVQRFEVFAKQRAKTLQTAGSDELNAFSKILIEEKANTYENYVALSRYAYFVKNLTLYLSVLELIDGAEVMNVLHERLGEIVGENIRDKILPESSLPPLGLPSVEKTGVTKEVMKKMEDNLDSETCMTVLNAVAHGLPKDFRKGEREKYLEAGSINEYLRRKRESAISEIESYRDSGALFFNQIITDEALEFVKNRPDVLTGERRGNTIYHTKIPYMVNEYLAASEDKMKRYYACHCAWARESILAGEEVTDSFCHCSGGFTKQPWEAALDRPLDVEMVKSVLKGDMECSFIIHLPEDAT